MKWHYDYVDELSFRNEKDIRNGKYLVYHVDTIDYLLNNPDWVFNNRAGDEQDYIMDYYDYHMESEDGEYIYIPSFEVVKKLEDREEIMRDAFYTNCY